LKGNTNYTANLNTDISSFSVTTVASVACKDISLDRASEVLLCD